MEEEKKKLIEELQKTKENLKSREGKNDVITQRLTRKVEQTQRCINFIDSQKK